MKYIFALLILYLSDIASAQTIFPDFLQGTWKIEDKEVFEHWDKLNSNTMKGFSYTSDKGEMTISEYLDLSRNGNNIIYTATVLNQNQGNGINFILSESDTTFVFENPDHDFPKKIVYKRLTDKTVFVQVSDGKQKGFSYIMRKQH